MIYYNIKGIRNLKNLSVGFVAAELHIPLANYIAIENGEIDLKLSRLFLIAEILGVYAYDLFYCTELNFSKTKSYNFDLNGDNKSFGYTSFSDTYSERYILKLKAENRRLSKK